MKKKCELCTAQATMHCESDSASLCWECDAKVHSANFLVERHLRHLLCNVCNLPTSWSASGSRLGRTISVCQLCVSKKEEREERDDCVTSDEEEEEDCCSEDEDDDVDDDVEEEEEQVVPSQMSSSGVCLKRLRDEVECFSDDDYGSSSSYRNAISYSAKDNGSVCVDSFYPHKRLQTQSDPVCRVQLESTSLKTSAKNVEPVISETCNMDHNALAIGSESADSS